MELAPGSQLRAGRLVTIIVYAVMIVASIGLFLGIRSFGSDLTAPDPKGPIFGGGGAGAGSHAILHVLLAMLVVIIASRGLGALFRYLHQPPVIGEVLAGILLGPSLLGRIAPSASAFLLPSTVAPYLGVIAQVGAILFMFLVGLELDTSLLRKKSHATLAISHASIIAPFVLGSGLALWLYPKLSSSDVPFSVFALFMGVSMSVTAFPVLARILTDRGIHKTRLGVIAISCAAVDDVTAWCLLAFVVSVAQAKPSGAALTIGLSIGYIAFMLGAIRPFVQRAVRRMELTKELGQNTSALVFGGLLLSALTTDFIGIHPVFGAFLLGAIIPHESLLAKSMKQKLEDLVVVLLLPAYFAFTGMRTQIGLLSGMDHWIFCGVIIVVACLGKFGGSAGAARLAGLEWRDAASLGILMNTRGLMELIVLNMGLDLRVISPTLFAMMILMALVTTFATTPILHVLIRSRSLDEPASSTAVSSST
ncbi:cation:proton antiporter [Pendulispora rubella]|uniref:Cation:proton antiporter n=1 Tax=Pendulispora rubella TaxID=2741070 RepID=A0ABZ2KPX4_9BACT